MTYKKNFVAAIKVGGKILRESSDRVELPFGSEYSVLLKNLDSVRMQARISIDGKEATGWLIVGPGESIDVERFVENLDRGNRFKFIERTEAVEQHRGIKADDGLVRVEFKREKVYEAPKVVHHTYTHYYPYYPYYQPYIYSQLTTATGALQNAQSFNSSGQAMGEAMGSAQNMNVSLAAINLTRSANMSNDAGITVKGSLSDQKFISVSGFETEQSEVLVLHLVGKVGVSPVKVAKTVNRKLVCDTCGKKNKSSVKFCAECGTSLEKF